MNADQLLSIRWPEKIFEPDVMLIKKKYRQLAFEWHPDQSKDPRAAEVFSHLTKLHEAAIDKYLKGYWGALGVSEVQAKNGALSIFKWKARHHFELGEFFVADKFVRFFLEREHNKFFRNAELVKFYYSSNRMQEEFERYLPIDAESNETKEGRWSWKVAKPKQYILLADVFAHCGGQIDPKHVAWILSSLYNICCYLSHIKISHQDISLKSYFIDPVTHTGMLLGGWWFSKNFGERVEQVPVRTAMVMPWALRSSKLAHPSTDLELVRCLGRELLNTQPCPAPMREWMHGIAGEDAKLEYKKWGEVLKESFGARRFTEWHLDSEAIYGKEV